MNRMLYLRDLDVDVLIRCRACGHEGVLPHAEALRRFGASYPVLSIAPHYRCSACNARDAESLAAPPPEPLYATPVDDYDEHDDDGGFAAALASLQNLVDAAHGQSTVPKRKAAPEPEPEPELPPPPINVVWDEDEEAAARAAWDAAPVWTPPPAAAHDEDEDAAPPPRRRDTPALPNKPFFASRERVRRAPEPPPPAFAAPAFAAPAFAASADGDDDDDFVREEPKRDPADVPLSAMPVLSLADIKALLGEEDGGETVAGETVAESPDGAPPPFTAADDAGPADEFAVDAADDEDDPLLSSALQRLLRNVSVEAEDETEDAAAAFPEATADETLERLDSPAAEGLEAPEQDDAATPFADLVAEPEEAEEELSDEELISFAIGDRDAASARDVLDALPPEMAALLADDDEDEDEVYEYAPDEIIDAPAEPDEPPPPDDGASRDEWASAEAESVAVEPILSASDDADIADIDIAEIVDFAAPPPPDDDAAPEAADIAETDVADEEPLLLEDEAPAPAAAASRDEEEDPDLAALRALLAETEDRDRPDDLDVDDLDVDGLDVDDLALDGLEPNRLDADEAPAAPPAPPQAGRGFERPPRDSLINDGDDEAAPPPAWRTQRPLSDPDDESAEGMEDALATLRALIEQAAAEPDDDAPAVDRAPAAVPAQELETDDLDDEAASPPAFAARVSDVDDDDPEAWAALMREVAAKAAGDDGDDTLPLSSGPLSPAPALSAPLPPAPASTTLAPTPSPTPADYERLDDKAGKRGGSLDDTLTRLRGLLDLPQDEPPRGRGRRR